MFKRIAVSVGALALVGFMTLPAFAAKSDNDGDADSFESTNYTEETDTNDGEDANVDETTDNKHPSGKDRSVEPGKSGTQGKAESNPDDSKGPMRYEGAIGDDKPQGPGGEDLADQDGNNGCGNDDDFDDDNNGWCGKPKTAGSTDNPPVEISPTEVESIQRRTPTRVLASNPSLTEVLGVSFSRSPKPTAVLGVQFQKGKALARTGTDATSAIFLLGMMLVAVGLGVLKVAKGSA